MLTTEQQTDLYAATQETADAAKDTLESFLARKSDEIELKTTEEGLYFKATIDLLENIEWTCILKSSNGSNGSNLGPRTRLDPRPLTPRSTFNPQPRRRCRDAHET